MKPIVSMKRAVVEELGLACRIVDGSTVVPNELQSAICSVPERSVGRG
jgi:hypothetical protein